MDAKIDFQSDCEKKHKIKFSACIPKNLDLPFFAYGFFKPHQIAFKKIEKYCHKRKKVEYVKGRIEHVNGMPVLFSSEKSRFDVLGYVLKFHNKDKKRAYKAIGYSKHMNIYKWEEIEINGAHVNTLVSSTPQQLKNFHSHGGDMKYIINEYDEKRGIHNYDWRLDPLYDKTISYIRYLMDQNIIDKNNGYSKLIKSQMLYTSLWTVLDRFLTFKYGKTQNENIKALSKEKYFEKILSDVLSKNNRGQNIVFSAQHLNSYKLDRNNAEESAFYYYTLRNNVVHSGKVFTSENEMLFSALKDLLEIFEGVLKEVRNE